jgi:hypothetical protein
MPMVQVWVMRVRVYHRLMVMRVRMRYGIGDGRVAGPVRVLVVFVMDVRMAVYHFFVTMFVRVPLGEMQPDA